MYNQSTNNVCNNYLQIFDKIINDQPVYILQQVFEKHGIDGTEVKNGNQVGIQHVLMFKKIK